MNKEQKRRGGKSDTGKRNGEKKKGTEEDVQRSREVVGGEGWRVGERRGQKDGQMDVCAALRCAAVMRCCCAAVLCGAGAVVWWSYVSFLLRICMYLPVRST